MNSQLQRDQEILNYLLKRRMCSVENLALSVGGTPESIWPRVKDFASRGLVRIAHKSCGSACSSCGSSCESIKEIGTAIVISLQRKEPEDEC